MIDTEGDYNDASNWQASDSSGGSPGVYEFGLAWHAFSRHPANGNINLQWISHPLRTYLVEWSDDVENWNTLSTVPASGTGITSYTDTSAPDPRRIYRISIAP